MRFSVTCEMIIHLSSHIVDGNSNILSSGIVGQLIPFFLELFFLDKAKNSFLRDLVFLFLFFTKMTAVIGRLCILVKGVDFSVETNLVL